MSIETITSDTEIRLDAEAVLAALLAGEKVDPVIARRIQERSARIRERIVREHGSLDIAVPSIRELRDE